MNSSESIIELAKALSAFQGEVQQPSKDGKNPHFKSTYVTLDGVVAAITQTAHKHGLSFMQFPINNAQDGRIGVKTLVMHISGEFIESEPIFAMPMKQDAQAAGSVITYLKRYSLSAIFGITSDEDDDGNKASQGPQQNNQAPQYQQQPQQQQYQQRPQQQSLAMPQNPSDAAKLVINFGRKHAGKTLWQVWQEDHSYIDYMLKQDNLDPALKEGIGMIQVAVAQQNVAQQAPPEQYPTGH